MEGVRRSEGWQELPKACTESSEVAGQQVGQSGSHGKVKKTLRELGGG